MLRLKDIQKVYHAYPRKESGVLYYTIHRKNIEPGDRSAAPYLCTIRFLKTKAILKNGIVCYNISQLIDAINDYVKSLPYNSDNYYPGYRKGFFEEFSFYDVFKSISAGDDYNVPRHIPINIGFHNITISGYPSYDPEKREILIPTNNQFSWREKRDVSLEDAIAFSKEHIYISCVCAIASAFDLINKLNYEGVIQDLTVNKLDKKTLEVSQISYTDKIRAMLQEALDKISKDENP